MKAKVGDWVMAKDGPGLRVGVVRYVIGAPYPRKETYRCDDFVADEDDILEIRSLPESNRLPLIPNGIAKAEGES
jgi:hypothetical protein